MSDRCSDGRGWRLRGSAVLLLASIGFLLPTASIAASSTPSPSPVAIGGTSTPLPAVAGTLTQRTVLPLGLDEPRGLAVDGSGDLFVVDGRNDRVVELTAAGAQVTLPFTGLDAPTGVAVDGAGNVFVADTGNDRVVKLPAGGSPVTVPFSGLSGPNGVAVDHLGNLYVTSMGTSSVLRRTAGGVQKTLGFTRLVMPYGIAVDAAGSVYVADSSATAAVKAWQLRPDGTEVIRNTTAIVAHGIAVGADGSVYIADRSTWDGPDGGVIKVSTNGSSGYLSLSGMTNPEDVALDPAGNLYVSDYATNDIARYPLGRATELDFVGIDHPLGVAVDGAGATYVTENGLQKRVVKLAADGTQTTPGFSGLVAPQGIAVSAGGDIYVTDLSLNAVIELPKSGPQVTLGFTGLDGPFAVAVDAAGDVFVTDPGNHRVVELPKGGAQVTLPFSGLNGPDGIAVTAAGDVYVADTLNGRILALPHGATSQVEVPLGSFFRPTGIAVDSTGIVYAADGGVIRSLAPGGSPRIVPYTPDQATGGLAVDAAGGLYVSDTNRSVVVKIAPVEYQSKVESGGLTTPGGVAVDAAGNLYVTDPDDDRVLEVIHAGGRATLGFTGLAAPMGVAVDAAGTVFVADTGNDRVVRLTTAGVQTTLPFTGLHAPQGIAVDAAGDVFVADSGSARVVELPKGGTQTTLPISLPSMIPVGVAVDAGGNVFVTDNRSWSVVELPKGGSQTALPFSGIDHPLGVAVDGDGNVFAVSSDGRVVELAVGASGILTVGFTGLASPYGVAAGGPGDLYVTSHGSSGSLVELSGWLPPGAPTMGSAVAGDSRATLTWTAPSSSGAAPVTGYVVRIYCPTEPQRPPVSFASTATTQVITGLTNGRAYTFDVAATSAIGTGPPSARSTSVTPGTPPGAPSGVTATGGDRRATVSWTAPTGVGGLPITGYVITPFVGTVAQPATTTATPATSAPVTGLTNGLGYSFTVAARSAAGTGAASARSSTVVPPFPTLTGFVQRQSQDFLGRAPTATELTNATKALNAGTTPGAHVLGLRRSADALANVDPPTRLYWAYFLRVPDAPGLNYWIGQRRAGRNLWWVSDQFAGSSEFKARYGALDNAAFVNLVYQNVLGRPPDAAGLAYWTGQLNSRAKTRGEVMVGFSESSENRTKMGPSVDVAVTWIQMLASRPDQTTFTTWRTALTTGGKTVADLAVAVMGTAPYVTRVA